MKRIAALFHIALWLVLIFNALWMAIDNYAETYGLRYAFLKTGITQGMFMLIFYLNYGWLVPRLLFKKRWWWYLLSVAVMAGLSIAGQWALYLELSAMREIEVADFRPTYAIYFSINGFTYLLLSGLAWYTWHGFQLSRKAAALEKEKVRAELQALTAKVNPHFLFNTLNNIYALVRKKHDGAEKAILDLSGLMHYMLEQSDAELVPLRNELKMLKDYIALQNIRLEPEFKMKIDFPEQVEEGIMVPPLLFVPLLENVFKHGELSGDSFIALSLKVKPDSICWHSANVIDHRKDKNGTGLANLRERLQLLYGSHYKLSVVEGDGIFETDMCIYL